MQRSNASFKSIPMQGGHEDKTEDTFKCVQCSSDNNIPAGRAGRRKCLECNFVFDEAMSKEAERLGNIHPSPETLAEASEPETVHHDWLEKYDAKITEVDTGTKIPRSPTFVFLSKDRTRVEFATKKDIRKKVLEWTRTGSYDLYELKAKTSSVKVDIA